MPPSPPSVGERPPIASIGPSEPPRPRGSASPTLSVLHVDQHRMFTDALSRCLADEADLHAVGAVTSYELAVAACRRTPPDVVLIEPWADGSGGVEAIRAIRNASPQSSVIVVSDRGDAGAITAAIRAGAKGYVLKTREVGDLIAVIRRSSTGEVILTVADVPNVIRRLQTTRQLEVDAQRLFSRLTVRERQTLTELAAGSSTAQTAASLHISPLTVRSHVKSILFKLEVHSKLEAVTFAMRHGLLDADRPA